MRHLLFTLALACLGTVMRTAHRPANPGAGRRIPSRDASRRFRRLTSVLD